MILHRNDMILKRDNKKDNNKTRDLNRLIFI